MDWTTLYIVASLLLFPLFIYGAIASARVDEVFNKYAKITSDSGISARELTAKLIKDYNLNNVTIVSTKGKLTDCYDPRKKQVKLSDSTSSSSSISALGVVAHEVGHAIQDKRGMFLFKLRLIMVPFMNFVNSAFVPLVLFGSILSFTFYIETVGYYIVLISVISYGLSMLFYFITLPLEYNASKRAILMLEDTELFDKNELAKMKEVLKAAISTYVSATLTSTMYFLRFLSYAMIFRKRD